MQQMPRHPVPSRSQAPNKTAYLVQLITSFVTLPGKYPCLSNSTPEFEMQTFCKNKANSKVSKKEP